MLENELNSFRAYLRGYSALLSLMKWATSASRPSASSSVLSSYSCLMVCSVTECCDSMHCCATACLFLHSAYLHARQSPSTHTVLIDPTEII